MVARRGSGSRGASLSLLLVTAVVWLAAGICRFTLPQAGLAGEYFQNAAWTGPAAHSEVDRDVSTAQLSRGWGYTPPDNFTIRWTGFLHVGSAGDYTFALNSDDGSTLYIDRSLVVDNAGGHGPPARSGRVHLDEGRHPITLEYTQAGGAYLLEWSWAAGSDAASPVPAWRLSPHPSRVPILFLQWAAALAWACLSLALIVAAVRAAMRRGFWPTQAQESEEARDRRRPAVFSRPALGCAVLFLALAIIHTWPLASSPAHLSRNDNADTMLNEWTLAWIAHQAPRHPADLFHANIFFPEPASLGFSEALILPGLVAAPMSWAGASPVLAYNLMLLAGLALTGWTMSLVVAQWTGDWTAGLVAGIIVSFNAHTLTRLPHIQAQHAELLFLALLALDALLRRPRRSIAVWLGVILALQALVSIYLFVFTAVALVVATLARPEDWTGARFRNAAAKLALAVLVAGAVMAPLLWPYWQLRSEGFVRSLDEGGWFAASARDYLTTPARWYPWAGGSVALFPGVPAIILALMALVSSVAFRDRRARMCLAIGAAGVLLSFGPAVVPGYEGLYAWIPLLQAVRTTSRFGYLGIVGLSVLAGYGVVAVKQRLASAAPAMQRVLVLGMIAIVAFEPLAAPIDYVRFEETPALYKRVASEAGAIVAELPFPRPESVPLNAQYLLNSTANWKPLLNGYSGVTPPSYIAHFEAVKSFPADAAMAGLRAAGVTDVFVHLDQLDPEAQALLDARRDLQRVAGEGSVALYHLER